MPSRSSRRAPGAGDDGRFGAARSGWASRFRDGALYVSAVDRILRFDDIESRLDERRQQPVVVSDAFPERSHHGWKFIAFGPDGKLYVPVGAPCNICEPDPERYASHHAHESRRRRRSRSIARGVRNSVGFDWDPRTRGSVVHRQRPRHAGRRRAARRRSTTRPEPGLTLRLSVLPRRHHRRSRVRHEAPVQRIHRAGAEPRRRTSRRSACASTPATQFPPAYRNQIFIAEHGSWNRSQEDRLSRDAGAYRGRQGGRRTSRSPTGWLQGSSAWGRPADVLVMPDGSLLVSDDYAGAIYRISYAGTG